MKEPTVLQCSEQCIREFGFHVCSLNSGNENPVNVKTPTGNTGKVEGQE